MAPCVSPLNKTIPNFFPALPAARRHTQRCRHPSWHSAQKHLFPACDRSSGFNPGRGRTLRYFHQGHLCDPFFTLPLKITAASFFQLVCFILWNGIFIWNGNIPPNAELRTVPWSKAHPYQPMHLSPFCNRLSFSINFVKQLLQNLQACTELFYLLSLVVL